MERLRFWCENTKLNFFWLLAYEMNKTHPISGNLNTGQLTFAFFVQKLFTFAPQKSLTTKKIQK